MMVYYRRSSLGRRNGNGLISQLIGKNDSILELALGLGLWELIPRRDDLVVDFVNVKIEQKRRVKLWLDIESEFNGVKYDKFGHLA